MGVREIVRPLPLIFIFLFAAVAVIDLVHSLREVKPPTPDLLADEVVQFTPFEPVFDLRFGTANSEVVVLPAPTLLGHWSDPGSAGTWILADGAALEFSLEGGGHAFLLLHCRAAKKNRPHRFFELSVNGRKCGKVDLESGPGPYRLALPGGALHPGANRITFHFQGPQGGPRSGLFLLVRRIGLEFDEGLLEGTPSSRSPIVVDPERNEVMINTAGNLRVPFVLDDRTDALKIRYAFVGKGGRAEVQVARPEGGGKGLDAVHSRVVSAQQRRAGRIRVPLHGRRGKFVFQLKVEFGSRSERLRLTSVTLVKEGDPTGRRP